MPNVRLTPSSNTISPVLTGEEAAFYERVYSGRAAFRVGADCRHSQRYFIPTARPEDYPRLEAILGLLPGEIAMRCRPDRPRHRIQKDNVIIPLPLP